MYDILSVACMFIAAHLMAGFTKPAGKAEHIITAFLFAAAQIIACGHILSFANRLGDVRYWRISGLVIFCIIIAIELKSRSGRLFFLPVLKGSFSRIRSLYMTWLRRNKSFFIVAPIFLTVGIVGVLNLVIIVLTAPANWDVMAHYLARVAYYIQNNNFGYFCSNNPEAHPKNAPLLFIYTYLLSGRNENLTPLPQFISYWVMMVAIYGISRKAGCDRVGSLLAGGVFGLLIEPLMEATTTLNDMILAAFFAAATYFLFAFKESRRLKYLLFFGMGTGMAIGVKANAFLVLPSLGVVALYAALKSPDNLKTRLRRVALTGLAAVFGFIVFALPSGYADNYFRYGNMFGTEKFRVEHSFDGKPFSYIFKNGSRNVLRFCFDFISLDGMPPESVTKHVQFLLRKPFLAAAGRFGINVHNQEATRMIFSPYKAPIAHEDYSHWGVLGFGLVWIVVILSLAGVIRNDDFRILSLASVLFILSQSFAGPYDPWRGRYFMACAIFAVPPIGVVLGQKSRLVRFYLYIVIFVGCLSAVSGVILKRNNLLITVNYNGIQKKSIFSLNRIEQLLRDDPRSYNRFSTIEKLVPRNSTLAVFLHANSYEYPLFGEGFTRTIIPLNCCEMRPQAIPARAEYLLYDNSYPCAMLDDINLEPDWHLRKLTDKNRECVYK